MRRANEGKIGIVTIVVFAAVVYACWQWGVPWADANFFKKPPPTQNHDADGIPDATPTAPAPKKTAAPTTHTPSEPTATTGTQTPPAQPAGPQAGIPADPREVAAKRLLDEARNYALNGMRETAEAKYAELIEVYKGTQAAEEGKACLKTLQSK